EGGASCYFVYRGASAPSNNASTTSFPCTLAAAQGSSAYNFSMLSPFADPSPSASLPFYGVTAVKTNGTGQGQSSMSNTVTLASQTVSPSGAQNFGLTNTGSPVTRHFTFTNNGSSAVTVQSITLVGTNPSDFTVSNISVGTLPKQVSTGSTNSFTFDVAFAPQAGSTGQRNATVEIHATENGQTTGGSVYDIHEFGVSGTVNGPPKCD